MNDTFCEHIVQRKTGPKDMVIRILSIVIVCVLLMSSMIFGAIMNFLAIGFGIFAVLWIFPKLKVEYEYSLLNHDLNVDIIYNQAKRKHLMSIDLKEAELIAPNTSHRLDSYRNSVIKDYSTRNDADVTYAIMCNISGQATRVLFTPDEEMINRMVSFLPRTFYRD